MTAQEKDFWNDTQMVGYFADKPADPVISSMLDQYAAPAGSFALDLGCGGGRHTMLLAENGFRTFAVDLNPAMTQYTKQRATAAGYDVPVAQMKIEALGFKDAAFSVVISTGVLHQAKTIEDYQTALDEISRILMPGGLFTMNVFTNAVWDDSYVVPDPSQPDTVMTAEGLYQTLLPKEVIYDMAYAAGLLLEEEVSEETKQENTGSRAVLKAHFLKLSQ